MRGVYGVPGQWPHISALYQRAGFTHTGHTEIVYLARVGDLPRPAGVPVDGLSVRRSVDMNGTRLSAVLGQEVIGYIEVETFEGADRLLDYAWLDGTDPGGLDYADYRAFLPAAGFQELTRTRRGWSRMPQKA